MKEGEVIRVDLRQVLQSRCPKLMRFVPGSLVRWVERLIRQDDLNRLLEENAGKEGADFCRGVLQSLDVKVETRFPERLPSGNDRRVVFVSNHPLGGLDGMALIDMIQRHYGGQVWFVVNDLLMAVKPLENVFLPINKFGKQSREVSRRIDEAFAGNDPIIIFPAGLVSRWRKVENGGDSRKVIHDLDWNKMFVTKCRAYRRDVVPLFFSGVNSMNFYNKADLRKSLGIKFNLEQILLPGEIFSSRGKTFTVVVGERRSYETFMQGDAREHALSMEAGLYGLKPYADGISGEEGDSALPETKLS